MHERQVKYLFDVLGRERQAIMDADFDELTGCATDKARILRKLPVGQIAPAKLQQIVDQIDRNQSLLNAALKGIKAASNTMDTLRAAMDGSVVYGRDGAVSRMGSEEMGLSQKL